VGFCLCTLDTCQSIQGAVDATGLVKVTSRPRCACVPKMVYYLGPMPTMYDYPRDCSCNELQAVCGRVLKSVIPCGSVEVLWPYYLRWKNVMDQAFEGVNLEDCMLSYKGLKRMMYQKIYANMNSVTGPFTAAKGFVKVQKRDTYGKWLSEFRVIMYKLKEINILLRPNVVPLERAMYEHRERGLRLFAKGRNLIDRASDILEIWFSFRNPVCVSIDCTRFDLHHREKFKELERRLLVEVGVSEALAHSVLKSQVCMQHKTRFSTFSRLSGELITALGNCISASAMTDSYFANNAKNIHYHYYDDGDDCLVFVEQSDEHVLAGLPAWFEHFGHEMRIDNRAVEYENIVFCQTCPIPYAGGYCMTRDPRKTIATLLCNKIKPDKVNAAYYATVAECLLHCNNGVPMVTTLCKNMMKISNKRVVVKEDFLYLAGNVKLTPGPETRAACVRVFDLDEQSIAAYESVYSKLQYIGKEYLEVPNPTIFPWDCSIGVSQSMEIMSAQVTQVGSGIPV
jgi:hypothetical protein